MNKLYLSILWHQHQPFYKDTVNDIYRMPWVYMHAIKDYYDMLYLVRKHNVKVTFNLVPVLLYQLADYIKEPKNDELLSIIYSNQLPEAKEMKKLFTYAFDSMDQKKIHSSKRYHELLLKKNHGDSFTLKESNDLKVHLLLSWMGHISFLEEPWLMNIKDQDQEFSVKDKEKILKYAENMLQKVIDEHKSAFQKDEIEVSTTPFFHPILPLLNSFQAAQVSVHDLPLPGNISNMADDVAYQISEGKKYTESIMEKEIVGFWPSEGSVSPAIISGFIQNNVQWIATDKGILAHSFNLAQTPFSDNDTYHPYEYESDHGPIRIYFRDTALSDLIGFTYSQWETNAAVNDFLSRLARIKDNFAGSGEVAHVNIILDGENAWEHYTNNGYDFLDRLYQAIAQAEWIDSITFREASSLPARKLKKLFSGSWIFSNLNTWIGHPEKNKGWEYLVLAKEAFEKNKAAVSEEKKESARFALSAAEGSDWFWWYGDDFYSHFSDDFDALFRQHLRNVYQYLNLNIPQELYYSIRGKHKGGLLSPPNNYLDVHPDGMLEGYFDWLGAGEFDLTYDGSTMHLATRRLQKLKFGPALRGEYGIYLALEGDLENTFDEILEIEVLNGERIIMQWDMQNHTIIFIEGLPEHSHAEIAQADIIEIFLPLAKNESSVLMQFRILKKGQISEKAPMYSMAKLPLKIDASQNWIV